ncbi:MAG: hypothetical protein ABIK28_23290, partial [Planctomycetota bacterium]
GMLAAQADRTPGGMEGGPDMFSTCELREDAPLTDRSLLIKGDASLWNIQRFARNRSGGPGTEDLQSQADTAWSCYQAFKEQYPSKSHWAEWRIQSLERAMQMLGLPSLHVDRWAHSRKKDSLSG